MRDPDPDETSQSDDSFGWTDDPGAGDPDAGGFPAEFVDAPEDGLGGAPGSPEEPPGSAGRDA